MPAPAFPTGTNPPSMEELAVRVGPPWAVVQAAITQQPRAKATWKLSKTSGWHLTVDVGSRRLFYLFPQQGDLLLKLVYNEKGVEALKRTGLVDARLAKAKTYAEGTLLEFQAADLNAALLTELLRVKADSMK
ncbi:MAG: DUF3788 family protein [Flavobacteriales bacterium]|nr:DUF3788 family protein [Flavobacteriales bacterium]